MQSGVKIDRRFMFPLGKKTAKKNVLGMHIYKSGRWLLRKVVPNDRIQPDVYIRLTHLLSSSRPLNAIVKINTKALFYVKDL